MIRFTLISLIALFCNAVGQFQNFNRPPSQFGNQQGGQFGSQPSSGHSSFGSQPSAVGSPGSSFVNQDCYCLPGNQPCPPSTRRPSEANRISAIATRIVNTRPKDICPVAERLCCYEGTATPGGPSAPLTANFGCGSRYGSPYKFGSPGTSEADFGEYPWMVALVNEVGGKPNYIGGGVIVSEDSILTAAHKLEGVSMNNLVARVGDYDLKTDQTREQIPHQALRVRQIIIHPRANYKNLQNDVAILKLSQPANIQNNMSPNIRTACLPVQGQTFETKRCFVSGWGQNAFAQFQSILKEVDLPIINDEVCETRLRQAVTGLRNFRLDASLLCAGGEHGKDSCQGDGGSPLVCNERGKWTVVGLVAGGIGCGTDIPALYVDIANLLPFIKTNI